MEGIQTNLKVKRFYKCIMDKQYSRKLNKLYEKLYKQKIRINI